MKQLHLMSYKNIWLLVALISIAPYSMNIDGGGVTANYFMIAFLIFAPWGYRYSREGLIFILIMFASYLIGVILFSKFDPYFLERQFFSLLAGLIPVLLLFVRIRIPLEPIKLFIIIASLVYSALTIRNLYVFGLDFGDVLRLKGSIGSQRYGFILLMGLFLSLERSERSALYLIITAIIAFGIVLQLSRAGYIVCLYNRGGLFLNLRRYVRGSFRTMLFVIPLVALLFYEQHESIQRVFGVMYNYTYQAFSGFFEDSVKLDDSSEGTRLLLWRQSIDFVLSNNPLLGSGMAGLYLIVPEYRTEGASAHGQYIDVFLRMGLLGLIIYLMMWTRLLVGFYKLSPAIFAALLGMFAYGLFHETTKLTQGAFVFFILLNVITDRYFQDRVSEQKSSIPSLLELERARFSVSR